MFSYEAIVEGKYLFGATTPDATTTPARSNMSNPSSRLIDDAQCFAEEQAIKSYLASLPSSKFIALWVDPEDKELNWDTGQRRAQVAIDIPEEAENFAIFEKVNDGWLLVTASYSANPDVMLAEFQQKAEEAAESSDHPCRRVVR